jgi:hypothetical protein
LYVRERFVLLDVELQALPLLQAGHIRTLRAPADCPLTAVVVDEVGHSQARHDGFNGRMHESMRGEFTGHSDNPSGLTKLPKNPGQIQDDTGGGKPDVIGTFSSVVNAALRRHARI